MQPQTDAQTEEAHASVATYVKIAVVLTVITVAEVATFYVDMSRAVLIPALITMSAAKFFIVVGWYMHLKYDARVFRRFFLTGLVGAATILTAIVLLFAYHPMDYLLGK